MCAAGQDTLAPGRSTGAITGGIGASLGLAALGTAAHDRTGPTATPEAHVDRDRAGEGGDPEHPGAVWGEADHGHLDGLPAQLPALLGAVRGESVQQLLRLPALADGRADQQQVALPVDALALGDHGRRDLRQFRVELAEGVVGEDQVGLRRRQRLQIGRRPGPRVGHRGELLAVRRERVGQVVRYESGVVGTRRHGRYDTEREQIVELAGAEHGGPGRLGVERRTAPDVGHLARELAVRRRGPHAVGEDAGRGGRALGGSGDEVAGAVRGLARSARGAAAGSACGGTSGHPAADESRGQDCPSAE